jgi:hypothetical protein
MRAHLQETPPPPAAPSRRDRGVRAVRVRDAAQHRAWVHPAPNVGRSTVRDDPGQFKPRCRRYAGSILATGDVVSNPYGHSIAAAKG